jgi:hypothetical protein
MLVQEIEAPSLHLLARKSPVEARLRRAIHYNPNRDHSKPSGVRLPDLVGTPAAHGQYIYFPNTSKDAWSMRVLQLLGMPGINHSYRMVSSVHLLNVRGCLLLVNALITQDAWTCLAECDSLPRQEAPHSVSYPVHRASFYNI